MFIFLSCVIIFASCSRASGSAARRGRDVEITLPLSFMEAVNGCSKSVTVDVQVPCDPCGGTGSADKSKPVACPTCKGTGQQAMQNGFFAALVTCRACNGEGTVIKNPCRSCGGGGTQRKPKNITVVVPPGVDTGVTMRLPSQGDFGDHGGPAGNLYVNIAVDSDPFFQREGLDIHITVPISVTQAILGTTITVPTVRGEVELKIPPGSQPSDKLLMRGRGVRRLDGGASGSQYCHLRVEVPKKLTAKQRELMEEFQKTMEGEEGSSSARKGSSSGSGGHGFFQDTIERIRKVLNSQKDSSSSGAGQNTSGSTGNSASGSSGSSKS
jgi:molecular chaperone DnaJ